MCFTHHSIRLDLSFRTHILRVFKTNFQLLAPTDSKILPKRTLESILLNHSSMQFLCPYLQNLGECFSIKNFETVAYLVKEYTQVYF